MSRYKVVIIFGTRPEAIKLVPVINELGKYPKLYQVIVITTGQHHELVSQVLETFQICTNYNLNIMSPDQSLFDISIRALSSLESVLKEEKPDIVIVQGDTTSTFIASLAAFYLKIPVAHVEAGLRSFERFNPYPEEINRRLTTVLSDLHFVPTEQAKKNLLEEGVGKEKIFVTGNTIVDALQMVLGSGDESVLKIDSVDFNKRLILVTAHRRENFDRGLKNICTALKRLAALYKDVEILYPVHLNPNVRGPVRSILSSIPNVHLVEPLDYKTFIKVLARCYLVLTDSGGVQEEAPSLGKPVFVLRKVTERVEAVEAGVAKVIGVEIEDVVSNTRTLLDDETAYANMAKTKNLFGDGKASKRIVNIFTQYLRKR